MVMNSFSTSQAPASVPPRRGPASRILFFNELSQHLFDFVVQLLPTAEEMVIKEDVRKLLEKLIRTIEPESRLLSFGSTANGFSLRNSDMDLCCLIDAKGPILPASDLVNTLGDLLERETKFRVQRLPYARIPIVKLALEPSAGLPYGISCDIGFENRLALENTRLLLSYASIDPTRVRTIVLFLKVWTKRRKINSPYCGTLSSYGYVLLVIYFLVHVKNPPALPNLQQMPPLRPIAPEEHHIGERNIWFFDDIELLKQNWRSSNTETVAELLVDFFKYYSREFQYNTAVASIRAGLLKKETKGWAGEGDARDPSRERNKFCIEDPFETSYNVARTVTKEGLFLIRGEFMRASRILASRPERAVVALSQLCEEREEAASTALSETIYPQSIPRFPSIPPQVPYTIGASPCSPSVSRLSSPRNIFEPPTPPGDSTRISKEEVVADRPLPEHMAPTRSKWTSPPPPNAPPGDLECYTSKLGLGLSLATSSNAREAEASSLSSRSSEATDDDIRSNLAGSQPPSPPAEASPSATSSPTTQRSPPIQLPSEDRSSPELLKEENAGQTPRPAQTSGQARGRTAGRVDSGSSLGASLPLPSSKDTPARPTLDLHRRASSGPPSLREPSLPSSPPSQDELSHSVSARQQKGPSLTLDTSYLPNVMSSPPGVSPVNISGSSRTHSAVPNVPYNSALIYPPPPLRQHYHPGSASHPSGSVTIYRSQPQATTFPLYQQADYNLSSTTSPSPSRSPGASKQEINFSAEPSPKRQSPVCNPTSWTTKSKPNPASTNTPSLSPINIRGSSLPTSGSSRNASKSRATYDPSAAFRIPTKTTTTVLPPSPPDSTKSFNSSSTRGRDCSTSSSGSSPGCGLSPRSSPKVESVRQPGKASSTEPLFVWPVVSMNGR